VIEDGKILDKESLLLLYDKQQRERINRMIAACGFRGEAKAKGTFGNLTFHTGSAVLKNLARQQIKNLAAALNQTMPINWMNGYFLYIFGSLYIFDDYRTIL